MTPIPKPGVAQITLDMKELVISHLANSQPLISDLPPGSTIVTIVNASRFRPGDEIFILSDAINLSEKAQILDLQLNADNIHTDVVLSAPTVNAWTTANSSYLLKAVNWMPLKRVHIGDLNVIPDFPSITIVPVNEQNDWFSIRSTTHDRTLKFRVYVQADNMEKTELALEAYAEQLKEILMDHIHPIIGGISMPLTADLPAGSTIVTVADTSMLKPYNAVFLRDAYTRASQDDLPVVPPPPAPAGAQEAIVRQILSPNQFELATPTDFTFLVARQAEAILVRRYLYDSRPSAIQYGFAPGGNLMKAAEITWMCKEQVVRIGNVPT